MSTRREEQSSDLFAWRECAEIEAQRKALQERINKLSKHSHKRVALQTRILDLTTRLLELEIRP
jgi:hypothetical protein